MKSFIVFVLLGCSAISAKSADLPKAELPKTELIEPVKAAISSYIQPNFERFSQELSLLNFSMQNLCKHPSHEALMEAQVEFQKILKAFAKIEFIRLGPLSNENFSERFLFWPDRQGIALKQVQRVLAKQDPSVLSVEDLEKKSVALQGLGTMEYILFGTGSHVLENDAGEFRCQFGKTLAASMAERGRKLSNLWGNENGFVKHWLNPNENNPLFRSEIESLNALVGIIAQGMEYIRDQRVRPILGRANKGVKPKRALFWRSKMSFSFVGTDLEGLFNLWQVSALKGLLNEENEWLAGSVSFEFNNGIATAKGLEGSILDLGDNIGKIEKIKYFMIVTSSLQELVGEQYAAQIGLPSTFSSLDGD